MFEVKELNVENEDFEKDLEQLSGEGWEIKCSYTKRITKRIVNENITIQVDWIILQRDINFDEKRMRRDNREPDTLEEGE